MVQHLQHGAQRVGMRPSVVRLAVQIQHVAAHRHGAVAAVIHQLRPVGVAAFGGVLPEGVQQVARVFRGNAGGGQRGAQPAGRGAALGAAALQHVFHNAEAGDFLGLGQLSAVGDVVGIAGEGVECVHVGAQPRRDQPGADREIFGVAVLAGPGLDRGRCGIRKGHCQEYIRRFHITPRPRMWSAAEPTVAAV